MLKRPAMRRTSLLWVVLVVAAGCEETAGDLPDGGSPGLDAGRVGPADAAVDAGFEPDFDGGVVMVVDAGHDGPGDAGAGAFDSGVVTNDAGRADAGLAADAGSRLDAGSVLDAGTDSGTTTDAGPARDSGVGYDAGPLPFDPDAGITYTLPAVGQALAIGTNTASDARPAGFGHDNWGYAAFNCYGSGSMVPWYSPAGAYVVASSGGHNCPEITDALIFDFTDATWKRQPNANGVPSSNTGFSNAQIDFTYGELTIGTGQIPAPSHLYQSTSSVPPSLGGGPRGSYLKLTTRFAGPTPGAAMGAHKMNLATGLWERATDDKFSTSGYDFYAAPTAVYVDVPGAERFYLLSGDFHKYNSLYYLDPKDWAIKTTTGYPNIGDYSCYPGCGNPTFFYDPVRHLIVSQGGANEAPHDPWPLRAIDLNDIASGWRVLQTSGAQPGALKDAPRWSYFPPTGHFYTHDYHDGQQLWRLRPPSGDWKTGTWVFDQVTVGGATLPDYTTTNGTHDGGHGTFMYVPAIQSLAWVSGEDTPVVIMRPPE